MAAALLAAPAVHLTPLSVLFAACFLLLPLSLSLLFSLALSRALLLSAARAAVQLALLASLLRPLFAARSGAAVAALGAAQVALSAHEVWANKARRRYGGMAARILGAIVLATVPLTALASRFILRQAPWWEPSRYVPLLGMVLGNAISAVTLGSNHVLSVFDSQRDTVEVLLTHGASRFEACRPVAAEALRTALLPVLNQMSVVGLISIPGMMTGAILGGASVAQAAYLQVIILYLISSSSSLAALFAVLAACSTMLDAHGRVRPERAWKAQRHGPMASLGALRDVVAPRRRTNVEA